MSSITIHAINPDLDIRLTEEARRAKKSKNALVKELLSRSLGLPVGDSFSDDYREFCGLWNAEDFKDFNATQTENSRIEPEDWPS
jgi:hypothetical protein